jgi:hypothetical protein
MYDNDNNPFLSDDDKAWLAAHPLSDTFALLMMMRTTELGERTVDSLKRMYPNPIALVN